MVTQIKLKIRCILFITAVLVIGYVVSVYAAEQERYVRVAILQDASSFSLRIKGFYEVSTQEQDKALYRGKNLKATVAPYAKGIFIGKSFPYEKVTIKTEDSDAITIDGRKFRGKIRLIKKGNTLLVVNYIELEDYLKGILYHEVSHYWPKEALKAQAIISRSYAMYQCQENKHKDFDLTNDIYSQVYGGKTSERYRTTKAVEETESMVLTYKDKLFPAYFHATCAGHTEDAASLWNINIIPLKGVSCFYCQASPHFNWHYVISLDEFRLKLKEAGYKIDDIQGIEIVNRNKSGRIIQLKIISSKTELKINAKDLRNIIGPNIIRSTNFNLGLAERDVVFEGFGWGHGVGLCQWGAYAMAKQGGSYQEILKYYYPESNISISKDY
jgi:stage II sporulation protein D